MHVAEPARTMWERFDSIAAWSGWPVNLVHVESRKNRRARSLLAGERRQVQASLSKRVVAAGWSSGTLGRVLVMALNNDFVTDA